MFTGSAEELAQAQEKAGRLAEDLARVLTELQELYPVTVGSGHIVTLGGEIVQDGAAWVVDRR